MSFIITVAVKQPFCIMGIISCEIHITLTPETVIYLCDNIHSVALFTLLKFQCVQYTLDKKEKNEVIECSLKRNWMKSA